MKCLIKRLSLFFVVLLVLAGCQPKPKQWRYIRTIPISGIGPIGIVQAADNLWLSDVDNNRVVTVDKSGSIIQEINAIARPMHIAGTKDELYIPQFGADNVIRWDAEGIHSIAIADTLDAPGGVDVNDDRMAIADFFNHRVLVYAQHQSYSIGGEGHDNGQLYYPTDVKITDSLLYIADAYNNRVEVYNYSGKYVRTIGWQESIKVAAGVEVANNQIFITDFYGNRLLIYDIYGKLLYEFSEYLDKPTDALWANDTLYVANFKGHSLAVFAWQ